MSSRQNFKEVSMPTDCLLVQILLTRSEAQLLFDVLPYTELQSKIEACDLAIDYLSGLTEGVCGAPSWARVFEHTPSSFNRIK